MSIPRFTAEASLFPTREQYRSAGSNSPRMVDSVLAQQFCRHLGQSCGGFDLSCCPGLRCTAGLGEFGVCVREAPPPPHTCAHLKQNCVDNGGDVVDCHDFFPDGCATPPCQPCCFVCE